MDRTWTLLPLALLTLISIAVLAEGGGAQLSDHSNISISDNSDFTKANGVVSGSGTSEDPFIIEGWRIDCNGTTGIKVSDTSSYFVIRDVEMYSSGSTNAAGLQLNGISRGSIENITMKGLRVGIQMSECQFSSIDGVNLRDCRQGVLLTKCKKISMTNLTLRNCYDGVYLRGSQDCLVKDGTFEGPGAFGIWVTQLTDTYPSSDIVLENLDVKGMLNGIRLIDAQDSTVIGCDISESVWFDIQIIRSKRALLQNNSMISAGLDVLGEFASLDIDTSNTVDGAPLRYIKGRTNGTIDSDTGQVILYDCVNMTVANLSFDGVTQPVTIKDGSRISIVNNTMTNPLRGIYLTTTQQFRLVGNRIINAEGGHTPEDGIHIADSSGETQDNLIAGGSRYGMWIYGTRTIEMTNDTIRDYAQAGVALVPIFIDWDIYDGGYLAVDHCTFSNNSYGVRGMAWTVHVNDTGFWDIQDYGLYLILVEEVLVTGCQFEGKGTKVRLHECTGGSIAGCRFEGGGGMGIRLSEGTIDLDKNTFLGLSTGVTLEETKMVNLNRNDFQDIKGTCLEVLSSENCEISGGDILNGTTGIRIVDSYDIDITKVDLVLCGEGIDIKGSREIVITYCSLKASDRFGIDVDSISDLIVHHCNFNSNNYDGQNNRYRGPQARDANDNNRWDDGSEGNYWQDMQSRYPDAKVISSVWDTPYDLAGSGLVMDRYPLWMFVDFLPPVADAGDDRTVPQGTTVFLDGTGSYDNVGISSYHWTISYQGKVFTMSGPLVNFTFKLPGVYKATLEVRDDEMNGGTDSIWVTVVDTLPPVAIAGRDITIAYGKAFWLIGNRSWDNTGIVAHYWTVDPEGLNLTKRGAIVSFTLHECGDYLAVLNVTDTHGNWATDSMIVHIVDMTIPLADAGPDIEVEMGTTVKFDGSGSEDYTGISEWSWWFGHFGELQRMEGVTPSFTFERPGTFYVYLRVTDNHRNHGEDSMTVIVHDSVPPVADAGDNMVVGEGMDVLLDGSGSYDNAWIVSYNWSIQLDGETVNLMGEQTVYIFKQFGTHAVKLIVTDSDGNWDEDTVLVKVVDMTPPIAKAGRDISVPQGSMVSFDGSGSRDNVGIASYHWNLTDWDMDHISIGKSVEHIYNTPGTYLATLIVVDVNGLDGMDRAIINVIDTEPPVANAGEDILTVVGRTVIFDGSSSSDNGRIASSKWRFQYDGEWKTLVGVRSSYMFEDVGEWVVSLHVTDGGGNQDVDSIIVRVRSKEILFYLGPFLDLDDNVVKDVSVSMVLNGITYAGMTDDTGWVVVLVDYTDIGSVVDVRAEKEGWYPLRFQLSLDEWGVPQGKVPPMERVPAPGFADDWAVIAAMVLLVAFGASLLIWTVNRDEGPVLEAEED
jgi:PKD repeat protein